MTPALESTRARASDSRKAARNPNQRIHTSAAALAAAVLITIALMTPAVRLELRRSFTRIPDRYTEMYFTGDPVLTPVSTGYLAVIPVSVVSHGVGRSRYSIDLSLTTDGGRVLVGSSITVEADRDVPATAVVNLGPVRAPGTATAGATVVVHVALTGHPQTLHYRLDIGSGS